MTKISDFGKFLSKYAGEAQAVANGFRTILSALPLGREDKAKVFAIVEKLEDAAESVANSIPKLIEVKVQKSDVEAAVAKALPAIVAAELAKLGVAQAGEQGELAARIAALEEAATATERTVPGEANEGSA